MTKGAGRMAFQLSQDIYFGNIALLSINTHLLQRVGALISEISFVNRQTSVNRALTRSE
jgi:hypothetical protein